MNEREVPKECYEYYITYTEEQEPRLQVRVDWKCVERVEGEHRPQIGKDEN